MDQKAWEVLGPVDAQGRRASQPDRLEGSRGSRVEKQMVQHHFTIFTAFAHRAWMPSRVSEGDSYAGDGQRPAPLVFVVQVTP